MFVNGLGQNEHLYREPSIDASCKMFILMRYLWVSKEKYLANVLLAQAYVLLAYFGYPV
jgi:hypothetical protein